MDNARTSPIPPVNNAYVARNRKLRRRFLLCLPELSVVVVVAGLIFAGFQLLSGSGPAPSSSRSVAAIPASGVSPVYSVTQVLAGLQQDPAAWMGHAVTVQGVLQGPLSFCAQATPCPPERLALMDDGNAVLGSNQYLPINSNDQQSLPYNRLAAYTLRLQPAPEACALNPAILCYEGTGLAPAPASR